MVALGLWGLNQQPTSPAGPCVPAQSPSLADDLMHELRGLNLGNARPASGRPKATKRPQHAPTDHHNALTITTTTAWTSHSRKAIPAEGTLTGDVAGQEAALPRRSGTRPIWVVRVPFRDRGVLRTSCRDSTCCFAFGSAAREELDPPVETDRAPALGVVVSRYLWKFLERSIVWSPGRDCLACWPVPWPLSLSMSLVERVNDPLEAVRASHASSDNVSSRESLARS